MEQSETFALTLSEQPLRDLVEDYEKKKKEITELDYNNLTEDNLDTLKMFGQEKQIISAVAVAYEAKINTVAVTTDNQLASLTSLDEFNKDIDALTGGRDELVISSLEKEINAPTISEIENRTDDLRCQLKTFDDFISENDVQIEKIDTTELTVADSLKVVEKVDTMLDSLKIDKNDPEEMRAELLTNVIDKIEDGSAFVVNGKEITEKREQEREDEIGVTVSNDGYIMNTASVVNAHTEKQYAQLMKEDSTSEAVNPSSIETTNDISRVGGKVKLETANENGTIETESKVPTTYEKEVVIDNSLEAMKRLEEDKIQEEKYLEEQKIQEQKQIEQQNAENDNSTSISEVAVGIASTVIAIETTNEIGKIVASEVAKNGIDKIDNSTNKNVAKSLDNGIKKKSSYSFER